jgi:hypothetical protein
MTFAIIVSIINGIIIIFMPKHMTKKEIYINWFILAYLALFLDILIGVVWDMFDYGPAASVELGTLIIEAVLPVSFGIIYMNFIPKDKKKYILYLIFWVLFSCFFEWLSVILGFMKYKTWTLFYSFLCYTGLYPFLYWNLNFIRKHK